ncbi:conserved hypothetical protein [Neospora caninum Liverpool]|uniref:Uncharacterized protein n=1 Tax=Neospora caninum (strain Liverpool) TaxID=572307 RepID=F0VM79_NEOCL|nr:conserved hypothetical protein [Neospora caninum Liverpool]CBZ54357.1 conserved hypothetical protein [Neospora caninum Liverpool]CEL69063.1 TPA: hypothetical protein BN1204_047880 [Neospora caninum Liverpool]|eukprot:XP_003884388.1 conserved hypothetical protein [Neospora caninum Liverpool]
MASVSPAGKRGASPRRFSGFFAPASSPPGSLAAVDEECVAAGVLPVCRVGDRVLALFYNATGGKKKNFLVDFGGCKERSSSQSSPSPSTPTLCRQSSPVPPADAQISSGASALSLSSSLSVPGEEHARLEARKKGGTKQGPGWEADDACAAREVWEETDQLWGLVASHLHAQPHFRKRRREDAGKGREGRERGGNVPQAAGDSGGDRAQTGKQEKDKTHSKKTEAEDSDLELEENRKRWRDEVCSWLTSLPTLASFSRSKYRCFIKPFPAFFPLLFMNLRGEEGDGGLRNRRFVWVDVDALVPDEVRVAESRAELGKRGASDEAKEPRPPACRALERVARQPDAEEDDRDKREHEGREGRVPGVGTEIGTEKTTEGLRQSQTKPRVSPAPCSLPPLHYRLRHPQLGAILQDVKRKLQENDGRTPAGKLSSPLASLARRSSSSPSSAYSTCCSSPPSSSPCASSPSSLSPSPFSLSPFSFASGSASFRAGSPRPGQPLLSLLLPSRGRVLDRREDVEDYLLAHVFGLLSRCRAVPETTQAGKREGGSDGRGEAERERSERSAAEGRQAESEEARNRKRWLFPNFHGAPTALGRLTKSEDWRHASVIWIDPGLPGKEALLDGTLLALMREDELATKTFLTLPSFWETSEEGEKEKAEEREAERKGKGEREETEESEEAARTPKFGDDSAPSSAPPGEERKVFLVLKARDAAGEHRELFAVDEKPLEDLQSFQVDIAVVGCGAVTPDGLLLGRPRAAEPRSPAAVWTVAHDLQVLEGFLPLSSPPAQRLRAAQTSCGETREAGGQTAGLGDAGAEVRRQTVRISDRFEAEAQRVAAEAKRLGGEEEKGHAPVHGNADSQRSPDSLQIREKGEESAPCSDVCAEKRVPLGSGGLVSFLAHAVEQINREILSGQAFSSAWGRRRGAAEQREKEREKERENVRVRRGDEPVLDRADKIATPSRCWFPQTTQ